METFKDYLKEKTDNNITITVNHLHWTSTEDSYEEGEIGSPQTVYSDSNVGNFKSFRDLQKFLYKKYNIPMDKDNYSSFSDEAGRLDMSFTVDEDNFPVHFKKDKGIFASFKKGEVKLYNAYVVCDINFSKDSYKPSADEISKTFGIQNN